MLLYKVLADTIYVKTYRSYTKTINLKYLCKSGFKHFSYLEHHTQHQIFKTILIIKNHPKYEAIDDNLPVRIYVNKIENITFKIKVGYYVIMLLFKIKVGYYLLKQ